MNKIKDIGLKIFNWGKKHRVITLILCLTLLNFCIDGTRQIFNILLHGNYKLVAKYPVEKKYNNHIEYMKAVKIDDDNIIFFTRQGRKPCQISKLNLKTKKFTYFNTAINTGILRFADILDNKIYLIYYKEPIVGKEDGRNIFARFDYKTDKIEKIRDKDFSYWEARKITLNNEDFILFKNEKHDEKPQDKNKIKNQSYEELMRSYKYNFTLYNPKTNMFIEIPNFETGAGKMFAQMKNGNILSHMVINGNQTVDIIDLGKKNASSVVLDFRGYNSTYIWLGKNKFIVVYAPENAYNKLKINTYEITNKNEIKKITEKEAKNQGLFSVYAKFVPREYAVLNPKTVAFIGGFNGGDIIGGCTKKTYIYNVETNSLKRITDFPYKTHGMATFTLNDSEILTYGADKCSWWNEYNNSNNKMYGFKLR